MGKYTPICEQWILARPKLKKNAKGESQSFYGSYPAGFLHRARYLMGVQADDPLLHVCSGKVEDYLFRGFGPRDMTVDLDPACNPDWVMDVRKQLPRNPYDRTGWKAQLADTPYSEEEAKNYLSGKGDEYYPNPAKLLARMFENSRPGGRVGSIHYLWPAPPTVKIPGGPKSRVAGIKRIIGGEEQYLRIHQVACVGVIVGYRNRNRVFGVWELGLPESTQSTRSVFYVVRPGVMAIRGA